MNQALSFFHGELLEIALKQFKNVIINAGLEDKARRVH